mmetsp:Transcript_82552/g.164620  ORF Transcript_82552/g.164620 Transcript_82552/m.164620 type:complete len:201 (-) Transcript_82552:832-1434(-)
MAAEAQRHSTALVDTTQRHSTALNAKSTPLVAAPGLERGHLPSQILELSLSRRLVLNLIKLVLLERLPTRPQLLELDDLAHLLLGCPKLLSQLLLSHVAIIRGTRRWRRRCRCGRSGTSTGLLLLLLLGSLTLRLILSCVARGGWVCPHSLRARRRPSQRRTAPRLHRRCHLGERTSRWRALMRVVHPRKPRPTPTCRCG